MLKTELIEKALFDLIKAALPADTFRTVSRIARIWSAVGPENQPALFLIPGGGVITQDQAFGITKYLLAYDVLVYTRSDEGSKTPPQTLFNECWAAIDTALRASPPGFPQTLGGLVTNAWIEGQVLIDTGILDEQCAVKIPIKVITGL
jgi:hypothetical protein